jgi:hypothetical protein
MPRILAPAGEAGMVHLRLAGVGAERDIACYGRSGNRLSVSPVSDPRRARAPRHDPALHVAAPARTGDSAAARTSRRRILSSSRSPYEKRCRYPDFCKG